MAGPALHHLDLSRDQRERIHEIVRGVMEGQLGEAMRAFGEAKRAIELLVWDPAVSEQAIDAASEVAAGRARQIEIVRHQLARDVLQVLTEEQRATFRQRLEQAPLHPGGPGGHSGPGGFEGRRGPAPRDR